MVVDSIFPVSHVSSSPSLSPTIIRSIVFRDKLYRTLKQTNQESPEFEIIKTNLKTFNKLLKKNIIMAKKIYYQSQFSKYNNNNNNNNMGAYIALLK